MAHNEKLNKLFILIGVLVLIWSYIGHYDTFGWTLLSLPVILVSLVFMITSKKFKYSTFVYFFGLIWAIILLIGAKYTYTYNPLFEWIKDVFDLSRNHYDRVGHFAQGFVPVLIMKEYFIRKGYLQRNKALNFILVCMALAFSAFYELLEFAATVISNQPKEYILDLQGDMWDTQYDMLFAIIGAMVSLKLLSRFHDPIIDTLKDDYPNQALE